MSVLGGPFFAAGAVLGVAGALKARRPGPTAGALRAMGLAVPLPLVRLAGLLELAVGAWALARGDRLSAVLVAAAYVLFAGFVATALMRGTPLSSCGCFGVDDTPPTAAHVALNGLAASVGAAAVLSPPGGLAGALDATGTPLLAGVYLVTVAATVYLTYVAFTLLPRVRAAAARSPGGPA